MENLPTWLFALLIPFVAVLKIASTIFIVCYIFFFKKLKRWFNKKAGVDFMPESRIEKPQIIAAAAGVIFIVVSIFSAKTAENILSPLASVVLVAGAIYTYFTLKKESGKRLAFYVAAYYFLSCMTVFVIAAFVGGWVIAIYVLLFVLDKGYDFASDSMHGSASSDGSAQGAHLGGSHNVKCDEINAGTGICSISFSRCPCLDGRNCPHGR